MRFGNLPRKFMIQLILFVLHVSFINAGNLDFYQDVEPEGPLDVNYEEMARYFEAKKHTNMRDMRRNSFTPNLPWPYVEYLYYRRQKEKKMLEALLDNPSILDAFESRNAKERERTQQMSLSYDVPDDLSRVNDLEEPRPYMNVDPLSNRFEDHTNLRIPYAKSIFRNENKHHYSHASSGNPMRMNPLDNENYPVEDMTDERLLKLEGKLMELNGNRGNLDDEKLSEISEQQAPEFTYKFDEPQSNVGETFAIRPNDPRYYEDETSTDTLMINEKTTSDPENIVEPFPELADRDEEDEENKRKMNNDDSTPNIRKDKFSILNIMMPEPHRRAEQDAMVVSSRRIMTNDIYFIAIVAGCSAAAMFALVLISLTWCRLQRGAKAAADIEYPAYGVTGPNKDISPSGDQRLAHSAQMYHFQHQKQQIIAMENRTAASRDPGSVSEAESDEENEEGDYTVYECPGLASTAEMEVKNPMFRDDPTPATPPQIHKDEDHI